MRLVGRSFWERVLNPDDWRLLRRAMGRNAHAVAPAPALQRPGRMAGGVEISSWLATGLAGNWRTRQALWSTDVTGNPHRMPLVFSPQSKKRRRGKSRHEIVGGRVSWTEMGRKGLPSIAKRCSATEAASEFCPVHCRASSRCNLPRRAPDISTTAR
jgi:hypothetical protein